MIRISGTASKRRNGGEWRTQGGEEEDRRELRREKEQDHHTEWQGEYRNFIFILTHLLAFITQHHTTHTLFIYHMSVHLSHCERFVTQTGLPHANGICHWPDWLIPPPETCHNNVP